MKANLLFIFQVKRIKIGYFRGIGLTLLPFFEYAALIFYYFV